MMTVVINFCLLVHFYTERIQYKGQLGLPFRMLTNRGVPKLKVDIFLRTESLSSATKNTTDVTNHPWKLANLNLTVALFHFIQFIVTFILLITHFQHSSDSPTAFVAGKQQLRMTNQAVVPSADGANQCVRDNNRTESSLVVLVDYTNRASVLEEHIYDFSNVIIYQYYEVGDLPISTPAIIMVFFLLSAAFQGLNHWVLRDNSDQPRVLHYLEYSITGSMCLVVMAINVGIREVTVITGLFGLFFGVNMLGACAELLVYAAEQCKRKGGQTTEFLIHDQNNLWLIAHFASWILFFFAVGPVLNYYTVFNACSERKVPDYMHAIVVIEMLAFVAFGVVQLWGLWKRMWLLYDPDATSHIRAENVVYYMDCCMIFLSLGAKTLLAWLLLGPALAVHSYDRQWI